MFPHNSITCSQSVFEMVVMTFFRNRNFVTQLLLHNTFKKNIFYCFLLQNTQNMDMILDSEAKVASFQKWNEFMNSKEWTKDEVKDFYSNWAATVRQMIKKV